MPDVSDFPKRGKEGTDGVLSLTEDKPKPKPDAIDPNMLATVDGGAAENDMTGKVEV